MQTSTVYRYAFSLGAAAALLSGCGASQLPTGAPGVAPQASLRVTRIDSTKYRVLYSFGGSSDGAHPQGGLIDVGGTLYGTTNGGGSSSCFGSNDGCGTVFSVTTSGTEKVLHTFGVGKDGFNPLAGLINAGGILYGTTSDGGTYGVCDIVGKGGGYTPCGTVFSITTSGTEKVLHSFGGTHDGLDPVASLIEVHGKLYGTTAYGGHKVCCGTVFSITPGGTEKVLYRFSETKSGYVPSAALIEVGGALYGTTLDGGAHSHSKGTVFTITPNGPERVLYSFGGTRGAYPSSALADVGGTLYGTTESGGSYKSKCDHYGNCGTIFSVTPSGKEKVLYSFRNGAHGANPDAGLIDVNGTLYGTTPTGGAYSKSLIGCGTVFSITPSGTLNVLHDFCSSSGDGESPQAGLIYVNGTLYGTTAKGGTHGAGTVFALTP